MLSIPSKPPATNVVGVVAIAVVFMVSALYLLRDSIPTSGYTFLGARAFGSLSASQTAEEEIAAERGSAGDAAKLSYPIVGDEFPFPEIIERYEYVLEGELPDLSTIDPTVYRRVNSFELPTSVSAEISQLKIGVFSLTAFKSFSLSSFTLAQDDPNGFIVSVDPLNNVLSLTRNSGYWQTFDSSDMLGVSDVPSDEALIAAADRFLDEYDIDASAFGSGSVDRSYLDLKTWVPDSMVVLYPLMVNQKPVWSMWGEPSGLSVSVSLRTGEVDNVWAPGPSTFEAATYELATDRTAILAMAARGGLWEYAPDNPTVTYTFKLGTPDVVLTEHTQYDEQGGTSTFYVPALRFPVTQTDPRASYQRPWVIVPLVQDILNEAPSGNQMLLETDLDGVDVEK